MQSIGYANEVSEGERGFSAILSCRGMPLSLRQAATAPHPDPLPARGERVKEAGWFKPAADHKIKPDLGR
jgi:hypothetical protein